MLPSIFHSLKKVSFGLAVVGGLSFFSCDESLPPRDLKDFLDPAFRAAETADVFFNVLGDTIITGTGAFFSVGLKNNSDEYLQAKARIHGTMVITSPTDPSFRRSFEFTVPQFDEVTIRPLSEFTVSVVWDQRDDSCKYVFRNLPLEMVTIGRTAWYRTTGYRTFQARGKIQFWPNVETKDLPAITFSRRYYIIASLGSEFGNSRSCRQFPSSQ